MADVEFAIGVRRAIVQNEFLAALSLLQAFFIDFVFLPEFDHIWFAFRQIASHGKGGFW